MVSSVDPGWMARNIVLDSLLFLKLVPGQARDLVDIGSGAGVPGLILSMCCPGLRVTLIEGRRRRASFLVQAVRTLGLTDTRVVHGRLEEEASNLEGQFDVAVARCASQPAWVFLHAAPLLRRPGIVIVAGSETPTELPIGRWVEVPGVEPGARRRFAVLESST